MEFRLYVELWSEDTATGPESYKFCEMACVSMMKLFYHSSLLYLHSYLDTVQEKKKAHDMSLNSVRYLLSN